MERVATGIKGFDELVEGGFPKGTTVLITGPPGSGKSIFSLQYLYNGIMNGENGVYVYMDSAIAILKEQARQMGWDFDKLEQEGKAKFVYVPLTKRKFDLFYEIEAAVNKIGAKRLVFDSLPTFSINMDLFTIPAAYAGAAASTVSMARDNIATNSMAMSVSPKQESDRVVYQGDQEKRLISIIIDELRTLDTTNLIVTYAGTDQNQISLDGVSEYACDGVVRFYSELIGSMYARTMSVLKMRNTNHEMRVHEVEIKNNGMAIKPAEQIYK